MNRRGVGIGAIQNKKALDAKFKEKGNELASEQLSQLSEQLNIFTSKLEDFSHRYRDEIKRNPQFRRHFQEMCASAGVDPLASSKGFWASKLGVGDFYYELAVQIIEVCLSTSHMNGGVMTLDELRQRLAKSRSRSRKELISVDDILRAIDKLKVLGSGFELIALGGGRYLVQSVPGELNMDHTKVLQLAEDTSYVTRELVVDKLTWDEQRVDNVLTHLVASGIAWVDDDDTLKYYYIPSLFVQQRNERSASSSAADSTTGYEINNVRQ